MYTDIAPVDPHQMNLLLAPFLCRHIHTSTSTDPPWKTWELDEQFMKNLSDWNKNNPEKTPHKVLQSICAGLESEKELLTLIPSSPFPAQSLVTGLAYLFKLGVRITLAKNDVKDFAEVINEIINKLNDAKTVQDRKDFLEQNLNPSTVADPTYVKQGKLPCDDGTRVEVLKEIQSWVNERTPESLNFLWLSGDPGCGKFAITASLAKKNVEETTDPNSYFPSIARQLANHSPEVAQKIHDTLKGQQSLVDRVSSVQATKLFIDSIVLASELTPGRPVVVIIDGLDETKREHLQDTATIFSTLFTELKGHNNVKVFISSRTDDEIRNPFAIALRNHHVKHIHLDTSDSRDDVSKYIRQHLTRIANKHKDELGGGGGGEWPGGERRVLLGERASGLFIWAVTAIKFIEGEMERNLGEQLDSLFDMLTAEKLQGINELYALIIKHTLPQSASAWEFERFRRLVGAIVHLQEPIPIDDLVQLLHLRQTPNTPPVNIQHFIKRLRTVLVSGTDEIDGKTVPRLHKSFAEFIVSGHMDEGFRVVPEHAHLELAIRCLHQLRIGPATAKDPRTVEIVGSTNPPTTTDIIDMSQGGAVLLQDSPDQLAKVDLANFASLLRHTTKVTPFELGFSSTDSTIHATLNDEAQDWCVQDGWEVLKDRQVLTCLTFSSDGKKIATCSDDGIILLWDAHANKRTLTVGMFESVLLTVAFSPDGKRLAAGSKNHILSLWEIGADSSTAPRKFLGHKGPVNCVAFSPHNEGKPDKYGERIASGSADGNCHIWEISTSSSLAVINIGSTLVRIWFTDLQHPSCLTSDGQVLLLDGQRANPLRTLGTTTGMSIDADVATSSAATLQAAQDPIFVTGTKYGNVLLETKTRRQIIKSPFQRSPILALEIKSTGEEVFYASKNHIGVGDVEGLKDIYGPVKITQEPRARVGLSVSRQAETPDLHVVVGAFSPDVQHFACGDQTGIVRVFKLDRSDEGTEGVGSSNAQKHPKISLVEEPSVKSTHATIKNPWILEGEASRNSSDSLLDVEGAGWEYDSTVGRNGCLEGARWYKSKAQDGGDKPFVLWALVGDAIIKASSHDNTGSQFEMWFNPEPTPHMASS
ncbi:hypothetical protein H0H81_008197 [Sphagnurus paluster]|uniref:Nephrocystin 3-like N-terminal domain-containing protein n=1 Tax=Sphagnurus paluster TaxID=117069 RepID=A0A9P7G1C8_9AGAR|nr:hypothetical protein H0H81_008197 [Sphagnurus paluster]